MGTSVNVAVQVGAVVAFAVLRLLSPGWLLLLLIVTVVGLLVLCVPPALALVTLRRRVLPPALTAPFVACAGLLLVAGATLPDAGDAETNLALWTLLDGGRSPVPDAFGVVGGLAVVGYLCSILWLVGALAATGAGTGHRTGPPSVGPVPPWDPYVPHPGSAGRPPHDPATGAPPGPAAAEPPPGPSAG